MEPCFVLCLIKTYNTLATEHYKRLQTHFKCISQGKTTLVITVTEIELYFKD